MLSKKRLVWVVIAVVGIVIGITVWFVQNQLLQTTKYTGPVEKVSIGIQNNTITALILVAKGKGYFKEHGLDLSLRKYPSGKLALKGMFDGEVNISTVSDIPVMVSSILRDDFLVLGTIAKTGSGAWIIARKDHGIEKPFDLKSKKIATQKASAVHFFLSMFLLHNQISESHVHLIFMKAEDLPGALVHGDIDAFSMRNPFIKEAKNTLGDKAVELFAPDVYRQTFNLVVKKEFIKSNPDVIRRLLKALVEAEKIINQSKEEAIDIVVNELGEIRKSEVTSVWKNFLFKLSLDQSLVLQLEDEARWAIQNKLTKETKVPNYLNYLYLDGLKGVKPEAVTVIH